MKTIYTILIFLIICAFTFAQRPANLRCEHLTQPLGIDVPSPRFTWMLDDIRYGAVQIAYRVIVGTDSTAVANGKGNIWDTQKVSSDRMLVTFQGESLQPFTKYWWLIRL